MLVELQIKLQVVPRRLVPVQVDIPYWRVLLDFSVHEVVETLKLAIIAALAVAVDLGVAWLATFAISAFVIFILQWAGHAFLVVALYKLFIRLITS
jgi:hypothetical protein